MYRQVEGSVASGRTNSSQRNVRDISVLELTIIFSTFHRNTISSKKFSAFVILPSICVHQHVCACARMSESLRE